jgi:hypothetical protein
MKKKVPYTEIILKVSVPDELVERVLKEMFKPRPEILINDEKH